MTSPVTGAVFKDFRFAFEDGGGKPKYIVVLCTSVLDSQKVIAVRTTSNEDRKQRLPVCYQNVATLPVSSFYIGKQDGIFPKETWILFDYVSEYDANGFRQSRFGHIGMLDIGVTKDLLACAIQNKNRHLANLVTRSIQEELELIKNL